MYADVVFFVLLVQSKCSEGKGKKKSKCYEMYGDLMIMAKKNVDTDRQQKNLLP